MKIYDDNLRINSLVFEKTLETSGFHPQDRVGALKQAQSIIEASNAYHEKKAAINMDKRYSLEGKMTELANNHNQFGERMNYKRHQIREHFKKLSEPLMLKIGSYRQQHDSALLKEARDRFDQLPESEMKKKYLSWCKEASYDITAAAVQSYPPGFCPIPDDVLDQGKEIQRRRRFPAEMMQFDQWRSLEVLLLGLINTATKN